MKIKALLSYFKLNDLGQTKPLYTNLRGSIWENTNTFTAFEIETILNDTGIIFPDTETEVILNILDSSVASLIHIGKVLNWGVPYKIIGELSVKEVIIPCQNSFFGQ